MTLLKCQCICIERRTLIEDTFQIELWNLEVLVFEERGKRVQFAPGLSVHFRCVQFAPGLSVHFRCVEFAPGHSENAPKARVQTPRTENVPTARMQRRVRESNPAHIGGRRVLSPLRHIPLCE